MIKSTLFCFLRQDGFIGDECVRHVLCDTQTRAQDARNFYALPNLFSTFTYVAIDARV